MRIAQVAPLYEAVPPHAYGGTERVVSWLTEELVRQGHDVTLFASSDSQTSARLVDGMPPALRLSKAVDQMAPHIVMIERVAQMAIAGEFDVVHSHIDYLPFSVFRNFQLPAVTTLHGRLDLPQVEPLYREFDDVRLISISDNQRAALPHCNWQATVHHGLPEDMYSFSANHDNYLLFLGRICPEKRVDRAIEIATRLGIKLVIAAKIDPADIDYYNSKVKHLMDSPLVEFIGEVGESQKNDLIGRAYALLFPIDWPEPFGLVMIEAMACGTPIVAFRCGSVPEIIEEGRSGFVCDSVDEAIAAVKRLDTIDRRWCRDVFEERFTSERMAQGYVSVYEDIVRNDRRNFVNLAARSHRPIRISHSEHNSDANVQTAPL